jgi:hypothetical protein
MLRDPILTHPSSQQLSCEHSGAEQRREEKARRRRGRQ